MNRRHLWFWLLLTGAAIAATIFFSSQDAQASGSLSLSLLVRIVRRFPFLRKLGSVSFLHNLLRKAAHFTLYFILGCGLRGLCSYQVRAPAHWVTLGIGTLYACLDEFHQTFSAGRAPALRDVGIDALGIMAGCAFVSLCFFLTRRGSAHRS